jgi:hypothetical protein
MTIAAAGKRNRGSGCWFYDSEMPNYIFVKIPKHFSWPCSFNFIIANSLHFSVTAAANRVGSNSVISLSRA